VSDNEYLHLIAPWQVSKVDLSLSRASRRS